MNFDNQLCHFIDNLCNEGHNIVLGINAKSNVRKGKVSKALEEISMSEVILNLYKDRSPSATCATNKNCKSLTIFGHLQEFIFSIVDSFLPMIY